MMKIQTNRPGSKHRWMRNAAMSGLAGLGIPASGAASVAKEYNVLFIIADDLGATDLSSTGSTFYETPHIDSIARNGMKFTHGYAACTVCSPSRYSVMTGKYPPRSGITDWIGSGTIVNPLLSPPVTDALPFDETTLAEALKAAGYTTFIAGKWHLGYKPSEYPEHHGFDINKGGYGQGQPGNFYAPYLNPRLADGPAGESLNLRLGRETAAFIEQHKDQRFFAYFSTYAVHTPIQTTREKWKKYRDKAEKMGSLERERYKEDNGNLARVVQDNPLYVGSQMTPINISRLARVVQDNPLYAGLIEEMDDSVGIVLDKLKELGLDKNTIVVFTSDNGGVSIANGESYTSVLPFRGGKGSDFEGGTRVPFFIQVPGITKPGGINPTPVIGTDFYPTLLELAGLPLKPEQHLDGVSLVPLLKGGTVAKRDLFWHYPHYSPHGRGPSSWMRSGDWKLIHRWEDGRDELYNLAEDIGEQNELAVKNPEKARELRSRLDRWLADSGATIPGPDPRWKPEMAKARNSDFKNRKRYFEGYSMEMLRPDWEPKPREGWGPWWGSLPND
jgi:arylsulfatase A-like enzyme